METTSNQSGGAVSSLEELLARIASASRSARSPEELAVIAQALGIAQQCHEGQLRLSGEPYIIHPVEVASILTQLDLDTDTIVAGLLHDAVADTGLSLEIIEAQFGLSVARLVDGVTKLKGVEFGDEIERQAQNLRKMLLAVGKDVRVILIKLADRLHNMRTLEYHKPERQQQVARETLHIFAPLAHRLGMWQVKSELEDLAFHFINPEKYHELAALVARTRAERQQLIDLAIEQLQQHLMDRGVRATITGRYKHLYSIYTKMQTQGLDFENVFDLLALRVIVESKSECYYVLGLIHELWTPLPNQFTDYIAKPKPNGYQSIHLKVLVPPQNVPMEVQIRTQEMHREAEQGVAAHWRYKEPELARDEVGERLSWLRQVLDAGHEFADNQKYLTAVTDDLLSEEVFLFTPAREVIALPTGSTPIDLAYRIHTDLGHRCGGAKVNGRVVPLNYMLRTGDVVEILTPKQAPGPNLDWLTYAKTRRAQSRIRSFLRRKSFDENYHRGRAALEREILELRRTIHEVKLEDVHEIFESLNYRTPEDLLAAIGYGELSAEYVASKLGQLYQKPISKEERIAAALFQQEELTPPLPGLPGKQAIALLGRTDLDYHLATCCSPIPGDAIIGYITRGRGVTVHRESCPNMVRLTQKYPERTVSAQWVNPAGHEFVASLEVVALDRVGLLSDIVARVSELAVDIVAGDVRTAAGQATIQLTVKIKDASELKRLAERINQVPDVLGLRREGVARREGRG